MDVKLNHRVHQSADRLTEFEAGVEDELRRRLQLVGPHGIVSVDGQDIDNDNAPCALSINAQDSNAIDVGSGTVVFENGEHVGVGASEISAVSIDVTITDGQVIRLEYGEVDDGAPEANPYFNFAAPPKKRKQTALEMLVIETTTAFSAQPADVVERSVVLGVVRVVDGILTVDNGRDTYSFSRPWFSPADTEHRSKVGTGVVTDTNPHGSTFNDFSVGNYTAWQALVGQPSCVLSRPVSFGRIPGLLCNETIPAGSFATDSTGFITGVAGALYAPLGFWPERLLGCFLSTGGTEIPAWTPRGRNVLAINDPVNFAAAANVDVYYTKVQAGSLPGSLTGLTSLDVGQPTSDEILVAGGNFFTTLTETNVTFSDVGLVPMKFDILVDDTGRAYKSPDVLYCNTKLDTLGATPQPFTVQPRAPSRLRVAISNYNAGYTEVSFVISGTGEDGSALSETVTFSGPGPTPQTSFTEVTAQRLFTANVFATTSQIQVTVRNGDGANTTVTVFAEQSPERPAIQDDLLLATVHWTGSEVSALYSNDANLALDRRLVTKGGGTKGLTGAVGAAMDTAMLVDSYLGSVPGGTAAWFTAVEDFNDPIYMLYPQADTDTQGSTRPIELPANSLGARHGYNSRIMPTGSVSNLSGTFDTLWMRLIPRSMAGFPARFTSLTATVTLYADTGTFVLTGSLGTNPFPPYQMVLAGAGPGAPSVTYGAQVALTGAPPVDLAEAFQGFILHFSD